MIQNLKKQMRDFFVGKEEIIDNLLICLFAGGHVLLEDVPGVGKTTLASTLAKSVDCDFGRIQCTPDTLPTDIMGSEIYNMKTGEQPLYYLLGNVVCLQDMYRDIDSTREMGKL